MPLYLDKTAFPVIYADGGQTAQLLKHHSFDLVFYTGSSRVGTGSHFFYISSGFKVYLGRSYDSLSKRFYKLQGRVTIRPESWVLKGTDAENLGVVISEK